MDVSSKYSSGTKKDVNNSNNNRNIVSKIYVTTPTAQSTNGTANKSLLEQAGGQTVYMGDNQDHSYRAESTTNTSSGTSGSSTKPKFMGSESVSLSGNYNKELGDTYKANAKASGTGSGTASGTTGSGLYGAYMQLAAAQMAANQARAEQAYNAQKEAAQNAYSRGLSSLNNAYNTRMNALSDNYNSTVGQLGDSYNYSTDNVNKDAEASLKQAYINNMLNQKNLGQQLTAQGLSGGATESAIARLLTNYGNSRNNIETTKANNLADLAQTYNQSLAQALQSYNTAKADADAQRLTYLMNLENALANNEISSMGDYQSALNSNSNSYLSALGDAIDKMNKYNYTPSAVTNDVNLATVLQNAINNSSNYNKVASTDGTESGATTSNLAQSTADNSMLNLIKALYGV